jgi:hypothetical protein
VNDPFDLSCEKAYIAWRARKLRAYPADIADLRVSIERLDRPAAPELAALRDRVETFNMALVQTDPARIDKESLLAFTRSLGLVRTDANLFADASAVSSIAATPRASGNDTPSTGAGSGAAALGDFIPYTNKPLSWHTDGYYNDQDSQVGAWCLFCVRAARDGGENGLIDHEMAYIALRDESPQHIAALCHPQALIIPAHIQDGRIIRPESVGPVFSCRDGRLHMRYSARGRNVLWRDTPTRTPHERHWIGCFRNPMSSRSDTGCGRARGWCRTTSCTAAPDSKTRAHPGRDDSCTACVSWIESRSINRRIGSGRGTSGRGDARWLGRYRSRPTEDPPTPAGKRAEGPHHFPTTREQLRRLMLKLSEILVSNQDIESFDELIPVIQAVARSGERFFRMDVKPPYPDTPENWEDRLEAAFSGLVR